MHRSRSCRYALRTAAALAASLLCACVSQAPAKPEVPAAQGNEPAAQANPGPEALPVVDFTGFHVLNAEAPRVSGSIIGMERRGKQLLVATPLGLVSYDVSDPAKPVETGRAPMADMDSGDNKAAFGESWAYLVNGPEGVWAFDISDPAKPRRAGGAGTDNMWTKAVALVGKTLVVISDGPEWNKGWLWTYDLSDPGKPRRIGRIELPKEDWGWMGAEAFGVNKLCAVNNKSGLYTFDLADPANPRLLGRLDLKARNPSFAVSGEYAYLSPNEGARLVVVSLADPAAPAIVNEVRTGNEDWSHSSDIAIRGRLMYLSAGWSVEVKELSDPRNPRSLSIFRPQEFKGWICYVCPGEDGILFASEGESRLHAIEVSKPEAPKWLGSRGFFDAARDVIVIGSRAYVAAGYSMLDIYDVAKPEAPVLVESVFPIGDARAGGLVANERTVFVAYQHAGILVYDLASAWSSVYRPEGPGGTDRVAVSGSIMVQPCYGNGARIMDVTKPGAPKLLASLEGDYYSAAIDGHTAYLLSGDKSVTALDISNPRAPKVLSRFTIKTEAWLPGGLAAIDGTVFVSGQWEGTFVIDATHPEAMVLDAKIRTDAGDDARGVSVCGRYLVIANARNGVLVVDRATYLQKRFSVDGTVIAATLHEGRIYAACAHKGLFILGK